MKRDIFTLVSATTLSLITLSQSSAQFINNPAPSFGVGVGVYNGYPYPAGGIGFMPYWYNGFYGNGMSMYGPPVPTYAPVPGTFGAADYRVNNNAPFFGLGLGWFSRRSPSVRVRPNFPYNAPGLDPATTEPPVASDNTETPKLEQKTPANSQPEIDPKAPEPRNNLLPKPLPTIEPTSAQASMLLEIHVPIANALVFVNNQLTKSEGMIRAFVSPPLTVGNSYQYDVRVEWFLDGYRISRKRIMTGKPGERVVTYIDK